MNCINCGEKVEAKNNYCPNCGHKISENVTPKVETYVDKTIENNRTASIVLGIISIAGVLLVVFSPISLILSVIGLILAIKSNKSINNTAGIILNGISLFLSFVATAIIIFIFIIAINVSKYGIDNLDNISEFIEGKVGEYYPSETSEEDNYGDNF